jgi:uncharacterized Tic20 family protein
MSVAEEIEKLSKLRADGVLSEEEFTSAKAALLSGTHTQQSAAPTYAPVEKAPLNVNQWCMFIHASQLANFIIPVAGIIAPIVLWQMKKDESEIVDQHGKMVTNWIISALIYGAVAFILCSVFIGVLLLPLVGLACVIFAVIGSIKANNGELWAYPFSFKFLK